MDKVLRALIVEDNESDAALVLHYLQRAGYSLAHERVDTAADMSRALCNKSWDILLCDYNLPQFSALKALELFHEHKLDVPFIVVSGAIGEETAVHMMKEGAHDVVMKANLKRLPPVIDRELAEAEMRRKHKRGEQLQRILFHITNAVITTSNLPALIGIIREQLGSLIDTTNFYIAIYDEASDTFSLPFMADQKDRLTSFPAGKTLSSYVLKSKVALLATRSELDKMEAENLIKTIGGKAKVWLGVPLISSEKAIGIVAVQSYEDQDAYSQHDLEVLMFVSDQIVLAIERKKAEQDLRASLAKAEEGDKLKTSFLANISHEIRTPMHSISSCSELLDEESLSQEERREYINIINESCQELLDVFQKLIDIAKIDAGQFNINRKLFNINDLLADLKKHYETKKLLLGKNAINFQVEIPVPAFEPQIKTDQEKLRQVLKHLLDNAIKFCEEGSVTFGYEVHDDHLLFFVKDTGIGIAPGMQEFVFEKFRQVEENYSRTFSGNGLGLPISKGLVKLLGGTIWLESEEGLGTTFYFTIPRHE